MKLFAFFLILACGVCSANPLGISSRIKDIASVAGTRENQLVGMGLVVSAFSANGLRATLILVVLLIPQLILAGAVVPLNRVTQVARYLSDAMISRWSVSLLGQVVDVNARLNAQLPKNDFTDQFDIDLTRYVLIMVGLFAVFFAGAVAALKARDGR